MSRTYINNLYKENLPNDEILIYGRIISNRASKKICFLTINDGSTIKDLQVVCHLNNVINFSDISKLRTGDVISATGKIKETPTAKQKFELLASNISIVSKVDDSYPLQKKVQTMDFLREISHLRPRTKLFWAIYKIKSHIIHSLTNFLFNEGYINLEAPIFTLNDSEGAGETFIIEKTKQDGTKQLNNFFGKDTFLTVSSQLFAEAYIQAFDKVFILSPCFRAEHSNTTKHVSEFWMLEIEAAFMDLSGLMAFEEQMVKEVIKSVLKNCYEELQYLQENVEKNLIKNLNDLVSENFIRISYSDAIKVLIDAKKSGVNFENSDIYWGMDLNAEHEKYLCDIKYFHKPVFVYNYPIADSAFYMKVNNDNKTTSSVDLLFPYVGEVFGGSVREDNYEKILARVVEQKMNQTNLQWYIDLRKFGAKPSSGFGLGIDRLIMIITGIKNIKDVISFPTSFKYINY